MVGACHRWCLLPPLISLQADVVETWPENLWQGGAPASVRCLFRNSPALLLHLCHDMQWARNKERVVFLSNQARLPEILTNYDQSIHRIGAMVLVGLPGELQMASYQASRPYSRRDFIYYPPPPFSFLHGVANAVVQPRLGLAHQVGSG